MKQRLKVAAWVLLVLLAAYTAVTWALLRGVGAYRLGTTLGRVLAVTRPFALAGAVLLALVLGAGFLLRRRSAALRREA